MKTKFTLILLLTLIVASVWYFKFYNIASKTSITNLLPQSSIGAIISTNPSEALTSLSGQVWWNAFEGIPYLNNSVKQLKNIQSLIDNKKLQSKLNELEHAISFHITANDQIETLHFVKSNGFDWSVRSVKDIIGLLHPESAPDFSERRYEDLVINEIKMNEGDYSFLVISDFLIFSSNPILIEDVIRTASGKSVSLFDQYDVKLKKSDDLNFILNTRKLDELHRVFFQSATAKEQNSLNGLLQLELSLSSDQITFNGLIEKMGGEAADLREETKLNERNYLPNGLSQLKVVGISKPANAIDVGLAFDIDRFLKAHNGSLTTIEMDAGGPQKEVAILAAINNPEAIRQSLDDLALNLIKGQTDTLYQEDFMNSSITFLNKEFIIRDLYGPDVPQFRQSYYALNNNMLIVGESVDVIKLVLSEYDNENTWGKIVPRRQFLDNLIQEASVTQLINFQFSVDNLKQDLKPKWKDFFSGQQQLLDLIDLISVQLSRSGNGYYSSNQITLNPLVNTATRNVGAPEVSEELTLVSNTFADAQILTKPHVVRNHNNGSLEILLQDANRDLYLISKDGTVLWTKTIGHTINGYVSQIDFYDNKRLQYLFATDSALYLVDRNGDDVEGFPKALSTELSMLNTSVVDYDNSKRYRYLGIDRRGSAYLFDRQGALLEGWNPKRGKSPLLVQPRHIRVRGKDCFIFVRTDGSVDITNRRGESYSNFPVNVGKRLSGAIRIKRGPDFNRTTITASTEDGLQFEVDFNGVVKSRAQLFKPTVSSHFTLISDVLGTDHIVVRRDADRTIFFNSSGAELFSSELILDRDDQIKYYNFRNESELYVVNKDGLLLVLDKSGQPKWSSTVNTDHEVGVVYDQNRGEYELFINFENQFAIYRFEK